MSSNAQTIFDQLAQEDTARRSAAGGGGTGGGNAERIVGLLAQQEAARTASAQSTGNAERVVSQLAANDSGKSNAADIFDQLAANNGQLPDATTKPQGPTIGPTPKASDMPTFGESWMSPEMRLTMPLAKALMIAHDKLRDVENMTQEGRAAHPIQAKLGDIADSIEGFLIGGAQNAAHGIGTNKTGMLTNPVTAALIPGAEGEPALAGAIRGGASIVKSGVQAGKELLAGGKATVTRVVQGAKVAQAPAQAALRSGAEASATDAGVTAQAAEGAGVRTLLDAPIASAAKAERATYDTINKAAGTDLKSLRDYRSDLQDALEDPTNVGQKVNLQKELQTTEDAISKGESQATANGVDPATLSKAEGMTQQRYAMQTLKQKLFNNESVVNGNVAHGAAETVNVDSAIRAVENLDKPSRFAPEGTPTRLVQALGKDGAATLKQGLYDAQAAGQSALKVQRVAKLIGIGLVGSGAAAKILHGAAAVTQ